MDDPYADLALYEIQDAIDPEIAEIEWVLRCGDPALDSSQAARAQELLRRRKLFLLMAYAALSEGKAFDYTLL